MPPKKRRTKKKPTEPMPNLIFQNIKYEDKTPVRPLYEPQTIPPPQGAKILLWIGVIIFSSAICFLWGWALKIRLDSFSWQATPESKIITDAQAEWEKNMVANKTWEYNKNRIKQIIGQIENSAANNSTSSSTTIEATGTTTTTLATTTIK